MKSFSVYPLSEHEKHIRAIYWLAKKMAEDYEYKRDLGIEKDRCYYDDRMRECRQVEEWCHYQLMRINPD